MGCNCNQKKPQPNAASIRGTVQGVESAMNNDSEFQLVRYTHPNRGQHPVYGAASGEFYGHRSGGGAEKFLVRHQDIAAMPRYFEQVSAVPTAPSVEVKPPPAPKAIVEVEPPPLMAEEVVVEVVEEVVVEVVEEVVEVVEEVVEEVEPEIAAAVINQARFDLNLIPGITPGIARNMAQANLNTVERILAGGHEALMAVKQIGAVKADFIYNYVKEKYG